VFVVELFSRNQEAHDIVVMRTMNSIGFSKLGTVSSVAFSGVPSRVYHLSTTSFFPVSAGSET